MSCHVLHERRGESEEGMRKRGGIGYIAYYRSEVSQGILCRPT